MGMFESEGIFRSWCREWCYITNMLKIFCNIELYCLEPNDIVSTKKSTSISKVFSSISTVDFMLLKVVYVLMVQRWIILQN